MNQEIQMERVAYEYMNISHVADLEPGQTLKDHMEAVHAKYDRLKAPKGKETAPVATPSAPLADANASTPGHRVVKADGVGWFDVVGADGKPVTEKSMRKAAAEAMADKLNG